MVNSTLHDTVQPMKFYSELIFMIFAVKFGHFFVVVYVTEDNKGGSNK